MSSLLVSSVSVGSVIDGRFLLIRRLGESEWSTAYLTELDDGRPQKAAIKIFPFESVDARATMAQWDVARTLSHPHLMPLFHASRFEGEGEDVLYVVTEYADETLSQILPERALTTDEARAMLGPVLEALTYLHNRSVTHGHLRPTNIMVVGEQLKLSPDFGWRSLRRSIYDPPEAGSENLTPAADIWSLGVLLVECLTQRPPVWDRAQGGEPEIPADIPEPFYTIARECLQVDPARRCSLGRIKAHLTPPEAAVEPEAILEPEPKLPYKFQAMIACGVLGGLMMLIAAFMFGYDLTPWTWNSSEAQPQAAERVAAKSEPAAPTAVVMPARKLPAPKAIAEAAAISAAKAIAPAVTAKARPTITAAVPAAAPIAKPAAVSTPVAATPTSGAVKGLVAHQALPAIPGDIIRTIHGHVNVGIRVEVDAKGNVSHASIDSPGPSRYFANKSLEAAPNWKFKPAEVDGRAAASTWLLLFQYGPSEVAATPTEEAP